MTFTVSAQRVSAEETRASGLRGSVVMDTGYGGVTPGLNPVEMLMSAVAACMIKGIERVAPMLNFAFTGASVALEAVRQDSPPKVESIRYVLTVATDETDERLALLHQNLMKFGTIYNTVAAGTDLAGEIRRA
ncbi:MAG: hypothetical protein RLZZ90_911 [Actinomycetota bacterium]